MTTWLVVALCLVAVVALAGLLAHLLNRLHPPRPRGDIEPGDDDPTRRIVDVYGSGG